MRLEKLKLPQEFFSIKTQLGCDRAKLEGCRCGGLDLRDQSDSIAGEGFAPSLVCFLQFVPQNAVTQVLLNDHAQWFIKIKNASDRKLCPTEEIRNVQIGLFGGDEWFRVNAGDGRFTVPRDTKVFARRRVLGQLLDTWFLSA